MDDNPYLKIMTAGLAGGLHSPYKGTTPATPDGVLNSLPTAPILRATPKGVISFCLGSLAYP